MFNRPLPAPARDIALLIARVVLGVVLFAHGWQKLMINGIAGTYGQFEKLGIPLAIVSASFTSFVEFVGGVLLVVGALTTTVVALDLVVMVGAAGFVHITHGIFAQNGGWELVGVIVAAELALAATGPGRFSVDHLISSYRSRQDAAIARPQGPVHRTEVPDAFAVAGRPAPARAGSSRPVARYVGAGQAIGRAVVREQPRTAEQAWAKGSRTVPAQVAEPVRAAEEPAVDRSPDAGRQADQSPTAVLPVVPAQAAPTAPPVSVPAQAAPVPNTRIRPEAVERPRPVVEHWMAQASGIADQAHGYQPHTGFQPAALYEPAPLFDPARRFDPAQQFEPARRFDQAERSEPAERVDPAEQFDAALPASVTPVPDRRPRADLPRQADVPRATVVEETPTADAAPDLAAALGSARPRQAEPSGPASDLPQRAARSERVRMAAPFQ